MLRRENKISLRLKRAIVAAAVLISNVTVLAVSRGAHFSRAAAPQERQPVVAALPLLGVVPAGLPVVLSN